MEEYENAPKGAKPPLPVAPAFQSAVVEDTTAEALIPHLALQLARSPALAGRGVCVGRAPRPVQEWAGDRSAILPLGPLRQADPGGSRGQPQPGAVPGPQPIPGGRRQLAPRHDRHVPRGTRACRRVPGAHPVRVPRSPPRRRWTEGGISQSVLRLHRRRWSAGGAGRLPRQGGDRGVGPSGRNGRCSGAGGVDRPQGRADGRCRTSADRRPPDRLHRDPDRQGERPEARRADPDLHRPAPYPRQHRAHLRLEALRGHSVPGDAQDTGRAVVSEINAHATTIKAFSRWLWRDGRSADHPLACVSKGSSGIPGW